jgi:hypothetical protein
VFSKLIHLDEDIYKKVTRSTSCFFLFRKDVKLLQVITVFYTICKKSGRKHMAEAKDGCVKPSKGPIMPVEKTVSQIPDSAIKEVPRMQARVGKPAPDFELSAFVEGGFRGNGLSYVSTRVISPLSDRQNCRQLPSNMMN